MTNTIEPEPMSCYLSPARSFLRGRERYLLDTGNFPHLLKYINLIHPCSSTSSDLIELDYIDSCRILEQTESHGLDSRLIMHTFISFFLF